MTVYIVFRRITEYHSNDACWDDGWYDDYYEDESVNEELIGVYATKELAEQVVEKENDKCLEDNVYYIEQEVIEDENLI